MPKLASISNHLLAAAGKNYTIGVRGAQFKAGMPFEEWSRFGKALVQVEDCIQFALGDWIEFGEAEYGSKYEEAINILCEDANDRDRWYGYLAQCSYVARNVQFLTRVQNLGFKHHYEVAPLEQDEQVKWLKLAVQNKWSVSELRRAIRVSQGEVPKLGWKATFEPLDWAMTGVRWFNKQFEEKPVEQWEPERRALLKRDLAPLVEIYNRL